METEKWNDANVSFKGRPTEEKKNRTTVCLVRYAPAVIKEAELSYDTLKKYIYV